MKKDISAIAREAGLYTVDVTSGTDGYPKNLKPAIIGFEDYDEAMGLAATQGMTTVVLHRRDGWQLWELWAAAYGPLNITAEDYGGDHTQYCRHDLDRVFGEARETIAAIMRDYDGKDMLEAVQAAAGNYMRLADEIEDLGDDETLIVRDKFSVADTVKDGLLEWSHDTHHYCIAVMQP